MYVSALLRDLVLHRGRAAVALEHLRAGGPDVYAEPGDRLPALFQVLSYLHVLGYSRRNGAPARRHTALVAAYFDGIEYNGEALP
jgi:hypothetical protein